MEKTAYRELCKTEASLPIFMRDWWMDAVCGDDWDVLLKEKNGNILAAMPLYTPVKRISTIPDYTQTLGIWFAPESKDTKYTTQIERRQAISKEFINQLKDYKYFIQNFYHGFTDWLPFYWNGFKQTTRYTYILDNIKDTEKLYENFSQQTRRNLKNARENKITVRSGVAIEDFLRIQSKTFERQYIKNKQSEKILSRLITTAHERKQGEIFGGYDESGHIHAVAFVVWQESSAYYIAGGGDPQFRDSGAHTLALWDAIQYVSEFTDIFDFEGSMLPGVERFFREFGAKQTPYFQITKGNLSIFDRIKIKLKRRQ
jgi:lipid II:glycine glycyltransferase (peptidoglycan interpeptide bridge formation enzyme)